MVDNPLSSSITYGDDPLSRPSEIKLTDFDETDKSYLDDLQPWSYSKQSILNSYTTSEKLSFQSSNYYLVLVIS